MKAHLLAAIAWYVSVALSRLPWRWQRWLATQLARLWQRRQARESKIAQRNLEWAFPELDQAPRAQLHQAILHSTALQTVETLYFWTHPPQSNLARHLQQQHGQALYEDARAQGRGVIVIAPHFGNWELLNQWLAARGPIAIVYAEPKQPAADLFLRRVRGNGGKQIQQIRAAGPAVRQILKVLKDGGVVGILPDQQPKRGDGVFAPFFGVQALTMTLVNRLAQRTGACLLYAWCERLDNQLHFALHVEPAPPELADVDRQRAATVLNADIERIARRDLAQYQWTYNRYAIRPPEDEQSE